jgi:CobQ-like glutamine amidotransferase family enzyme
MGGAQDTQQEIVNKDLFERKGNTLRKLIGDSVPGLFICGAYQFLGRYYKTAEGKKLPGLEIFPSYTENPGEKHKRLISNIIIEKNKEKYVGFENHGGRTYLDDPQTAFGTVIKGFGNNGTDKTEGIIFKNSIGTYLHGPILPKNPTLTDWFIQKALERKYDEKIDLKELNDFLEHKAKNTILSRFR